MAPSRRPLGLALTVPALAVPGLVAAASPAAAVQAPPTKPLPARLDVYVPYQGQTICDPRPRPGVYAFAKLMTTHYGMGSTALIGRACSTGPSEHYDGRAWDWMLNVDNPQQEAVAQSVLAWLTAPDKNGVRGAMARRFGIMYIIHDRTMWRSYATDRGWAPYYGTSPHTDHIHFSFNYDGAAGRTSWWTGVPTTSYLTTLPPAGTTLPSAPPGPTPSTPVPTAPVVLSYGMRSEAVRQLQVRLGNLPTTGYYGDLTKARVIAYQRFVGLPQTGVADLRTQEILVARGWKSVTEAYPTLRFGMTSAAVRTLQTKLGSLPLTGYYGSMTQARVTAYQRFVGLPQTGVADPVTQARLWVRGWSGTPAGTTTYPTLRFGMTSDAVKKLQTKLGALPVTGYYGSMTQARVTAYQRFVGLPQTGVADSRTQELLYTRGWATQAAAQTRAQAPVQAPDPAPLPKDPDMTLHTASSTPDGSLAASSVASTEVAGVAFARTAVARGSVARVDVRTDYTAYKSLTIGAGARGAAVRVLQRALGGLAIDGVYGDLTRDKVASLQRTLAQPPTGVVTPDLWDVLEARDFPFLDSRTTVLRLGDNGPAVLAVQRLLGVSETGVFDGATRDAVRSAQARAGLASTGVVASRTWSLFDRLSA